MSHACRPGCAACCIAASISSYIPALNGPKLAGLPCPHLDRDLLCTLFGRRERPEVCTRLQPEPAMCGSCREEALATLEQWERHTRPD